MGIQPKFIQYHSDIGKCQSTSVVVLGLGLEGQVLGLGLEGKSLVLAVGSSASWPCDLSDLYCYSRNDLNHFHLQLNNPTLQTND